MLRRKLADGLQHRGRAAGEQLPSRRAPLELGEQRLRHNALLAVAPILRGHAHLPAQRAEFRFAQNVNTPPSADEYNALLGRALRQQKESGHAVAAGDQQRNLAAGTRHGEPVAERADEAKLLAGAHSRQHFGALADGLVEEGQGAVRHLEDAERPPQQRVPQRQNPDVNKLARLHQGRNLRGTHHHPEV